MRILRFALAVLLTLIVVGAGAAACREPTQVTLEVRLDKNLQCARVTKTSITVGLDPKVVEYSAGDGRYNAETSSCDPATGFVGTLVVTPPESGDVAAAIVIVAVDGKSLKDCTKPLYAGCIVARRRFSFSDSRRLVVPVSLDASCLNIPCDENSTCTNGLCVESVIAPCSGAGCAEPGENDEGGVLDGAVIDRDVPKVPPFCDDQNMLFCRGPQDPYDPVACNGEPCCLNEEKRPTCPNPSSCDDASGTRFCCSEAQCPTGYACSGRSGASAGTCQIPAGAAVCNSQGLQCGSPVMRCAGDEGFACCENGVNANACTQGGSCAAARRCCTEFDCTTLQTCEIATWDTPRNADKCSAMPNASAFCDRNGALFCGTPLSSCHGPGQVCCAQQISSSFVCGSNSCAPGLARRCCGDENCPPQWTCNGGGGSMAAAGTCQPPAPGSAYCDGTTLRCGDPVEVCEGAAKACCLPFGAGDQEHVCNGAGACGMDEDRKCCDDSDCDAGEICPLAVNSGEARTCQKVALPPPPPPPP